MVKKTFVLFLAVTAVLFFAGANTALAGAKLKIDDDSNIDLGFRLQTLYLNTDDTSVQDAGGKYETKNDFKIRRARFRLKGNVTKWVSAFIQTEFSEGATDSAADMRIIDAFVTVKAHPWANIVMGENMAPALRQNLTSSGALLAADRPGIVSKNLTWGLRHTSAIQNTPTPGTAASGSNLGAGSVAVRDMGVTLFGSGKATDMVSAKYYIGVYDGRQETGSGESRDNKRFTGRLQVNFFDAEPGYYNAATYLGKKKTVGIGASVDSQAKVATATDYSQYTIDAFTEYPVGPGTITGELAYVTLDMDNNFQNTEGNGLYIQGGYYINQWQPWFLYEYWDADAAGGVGDLTNWRVGLSYYLKGHNAACKIAYESTKSDQNFSGTNDDSIDTFLFGIYVTY